MNRFVFNTAELKPLRPQPEGRVRLRLRYGEIARAFVRTADGIREYYLRDCGDHWELGPLRAENLTQK